MKGGGFKGRSSAALIGVLCAGAVVRILAMTLYSTADLNYFGGDTTRYLRLPYTSNHGVFSDPLLPAGYTLFLDGVRAVSGRLPVTIGLQHLLGLAAAAFVYVALRRIGAPRWTALVPAAVLALSGDQIFMEHALLTEGLFIPLVVAGVSASVVALGSPRRLEWLAFGGVLLGLASIVRLPGLVLPVAVAAWAVFALGETGWRRLRGPLVAVGSAASVVLVYVAIAHANGPFDGIGEMSGWELYQRVSVFADCDRFTPPAGTAQWCPTDESRRHGPNYVSSAGSPASGSYGPGTSPRAGAFARAAIVHQPLDYLGVVAVDTARFVAPELGHPDPFAGSRPREMSFSNTVPSNQGDTAEQLAEHLRYLYGAVDADAQPGARILGAYQDVFRMHGLLVLALLLLGVGGVAYGRGRARSAATLFLVSALALYVVPTATVTYDVRFGVPPAPLLAAAAALGLWAILDRRAPARRDDVAHRRAPDFQEAGTA